MGYYVPKTLKECTQWIVWDKNKIPYSPITKGKAKVNDSKTWASYEQAVNFQEYGGEFKGIGFVFTDLDNLVFIDLDHCINDDGEITGTAKEVLKMFPDTYIEVSQSETGLHIVCKGNINKSFRNDSAGIEVYSSGRYMAFTGNAIQLCEPQLKNKELSELCKLYDKKLPKEKNETHNISHTSSEPQNAVLKVDSVEVDEVIENILKSKQGAKFKALHNGQWQSFGYPSQSEADLVYISIVNHFAKGNEGIIKAIAESSELFKSPKPNQRTPRKEIKGYIERTIAKAKSTYTKSTSMANKIDRSYITDTKRSQRRIRGKAT